MSLLDVQIASMATAHMYYLVSGQVLRSYGNAAANIVPYQVFDCSDGKVILAVGNDGQFAKFCEVAGQPELAQDERYATNAGRVRNRGTLIPLLETILIERSRSDWFSALEPAGVPCGPINNMAEVFADPQVHHRGLRVEVPHPLSGTISQVANPIRFSETPIEYAAAPPTLGEHTRQILQNHLKMDDDQVANLAAAGVI
jgi:crotonobetainyl-CoA:carnitine CoA-transferase CaiB-like acyl-CoA transferase